MSAATLAFIGGRLRFFDRGAKFGVHQFSFKDPSPDNVSRSQVLSAKIANYVIEMGVSPEFLDISSSIRNIDIEYIDEDQLRRLNVITGGATDVAWTVQARAGMLYVKGERDSIWGHHKVMLCFIRGTGFLFYAVIEAQGREHELTKFPLVEIALNDEDVRIDVSERCSRIVHGMYVNVFAKITEDEARQIAFSEAFGVQIRMTNDAPMFFGVAPMNTEGGKEELQTFFGILCGRK